ncbi:MAG TPA: replication initiator protein A, partial [Planctomycetaceae bacterium]|nr:replication initiator protein A [Planctomycetaceae bacterium]
KQKHYNQPLDSAVDELNLAEFPLAAISDRFLDGTKTVVLEDTVFDREQNKYLPRQLTLSGSDRYGLPTSKDDDVLLACIQLSRINDFNSREVSFSRYEILRLLGWADETRNYDRVATSLRRWKGLSIFSDRAFYDHEQKSWVNRDFGVFDNLVIYRREVIQGRAAPGCSRFVWNEVLFRSFQSGYLKQLDWNLYCKLTSPVAKRLYRFLDKRFYHSNRVEIDLMELGLRKVRLSGNYNTAQLKRTLQKGTEELERLWELKQRSPEDRFRKNGLGKWIAIFERKARRSRTTVESIISNVATIAPSTPVLNAGANPQELERQLIKRGIGPASAEELSLSQPATRIREMLELYDWYNSRGQPRGPGFLVQSLKKPDTIAFPPGFESSVQRQQRQQAKEVQKQAQQRATSKRERQALRKQNSRQRAFTAFWEAMAPSEQDIFETEALEAADPMKKRLYLQASGKGGKAFEVYRQMVLMDQFERTHGLGSAAAPVLIKC